MFLFLAGGLSTILLVASLGWHSLSWLCFFALVPLLFIFDRKSNSNKVVTTILISWGVGFIYFSLLLLWFINTTPEIWQLHPLDTTVATIRVIGWVLTTVILSASFGCWAWFCAKNKVFKSVYKSYILIPSAWIVFEWLRSLFISILWWAPDKTHIAADFNIGSLGFIGINTPLAPIARVAGLYGVVFCVIVVNIIFYYVVLRKFKKAFIGFIFILLLLIISYTFKPNTNGDQIRVATINLGTDQSILNEGSLNSLRNYKNNPLPPDITVMPESAPLYESDKNDNFTNLIRQTANQTKPGLFIYSVGEFDMLAGHRNLLTAVNEKGQIISRQAKSFLIPFGEYLPWLTKYTLENLGKWGFLEEYQQKRSFATSKEPEQPINYRDLHVGSLVCSGVMSLRLYRNLALNGAEILTNSASLEAFEGSRYYKNQSLDFGIFHAIANGRPFVQSSRSGESFIIDHLGNVQEISKLNSSELIQATVSPVSEKTPYTKLGEWVLPISFLITLWAIFNKHFHITIHWLRKSRKNIH